MHPFLVRSIIQSAAACVVVFSESSSSIMFSSKFILMMKKKFSVEGITKLCITHFSVCSTEVETPILGHNAVVEGF